MTVKSRSIVLLLAFVMAASLGTGNAFAQKKKLRMASWLPPLHHMTASARAWADTVEKASGGTLEIDVLKTGLGKPPAQYDLTKNNIVDLAYGVAGYTPGRFPAFQMMELPFFAPDAEAGSAALWDWYTRNGLHLKEMGDVKLISAFVHGPGVLHSKSKITKLEDLKGLKTRVGGGGVEMGKRLGAVPVPMSATKNYESLQKGTTTATFLPWESVKGFNIAELVKYHLEIPGGLYTTSFFVSMSPKTWESLSAKQKKAFEEAGGLNGSRFLGNRWAMADKEGLKAAKDAGNSVSTLSESEVKRWAEKLEFMEPDWIAKVNEKGLDGKALLADLKKTLTKYSK